MADLSSSEIYAKDVQATNSDDQVIKEFEGQTELPPTERQAEVDQQNQQIQAEDDKVIQAFENFTGSSEQQQAPAGPNGKPAEQGSSVTHQELYNTLKSTYGGNYFGDQFAETFSPKTVPGRISTQVAASLTDAIQETGNAVMFGADAVDNWLTKKGYTKEEFMAKPTRLDFVDKIYPSPSDTPERVTRAVAKYMVPMFLSRNLVGSAALKFGKGALVTAGFQFVATDPKEERLSNIVQESGPAFMKPLAQYLAAEKDDGEFEGRLKNAGEGLLLDASLAVGFAGMAKAYKGARAIKGHFVESAADKVLATATKDFEALAAKAPAGVNDEIATIDPSLVLGSAKKGGTVKGFTVNVERLTDEDDLRGFIKSFVEKNQDSINVVRGGTVSDASLIAKAGELGRNPDVVQRLANLQPGATVSAEEKLVIDGMFVNTSEQLQKFVKTFDPENASIAEWKTFNDHLIAMDKLSKVSYATSAEAGRTLRSTQLISKMPAAQKAKYAMEQIKLMGGEGNLKQIAGVIKDIADTSPEDFIEQMGKVMKKSTGRKIFDAALEVRMNGLLSSAKTLVVGAISPMLVTGPAAILERGLGRLWTIAAKDANGVAKGEVGQMVSAYASESGRLITTITGGFQDWITQAGRAIREGEFGTFIKSEGKAGVRSLKEAGKRPPARMNYGSVLEPQDLTPAISSKAFGMNPDSTLGGMVDMTAATIRAPSYFLSRSDQMVGQVLYNMEKRSLAMRELAHKGIDATSVEGQKVFQQLISDMPDSVDTPWINESAKNIKEQGIQFAQTNKFSAKLEGIAGQVDDIIKADFMGAPWLRLFMPFSRVEMNMITYGLERFPGLGMMSQKVRSDLAEGGARAAMAKAKMSMGAMFLATGGMLAANGLITGSGPRNKDMRKFLDQNGWQPNSLKIGNTYYKHDRVGDPFSGFLSLAADIADIAHSAQESKPQEYQQLAAAAAYSVADTLTPEFLTRNLADLLETLNPDNEKGGAQAIVNNLVKGQIPFSGALREIRKDGMPFGLTDGDRTVRETFADPASSMKGVEELKNAIIADLPYFSDRLPARRNMWGEPVVYPAGFGPDTISPIASKDEPKGQRKLVVDELVRLGVAGKAYHPQAPDGEQYLVIKMPPKTIQKNIGGQSIAVDMSPVQYDKYVQLASGNGLKPQYYPLGRQLSLEQAMAEEIKGNWPSLGTQKNVQNKRIYMSQLVSKYREAAAAQLQVEDPSLNQKYMDLMQRVVNVRSALDEQPQR